MRYSANITAGSLKVAESRIIADLLLRDLDRQAWQAAIFDKNILQARSPATAKRLSRLIRQRLALMGPELWMLVRDGTADVATHAVLSAAVKHSPLLGDFLDLVVRGQYRIFSHDLPSTLWAGYLDDCRGRDPDMPLWNESTRIRLQSTVYQIMAQAGYIDGTRTRRLQRVRIAAPVVDYLETHGEDYVLKCIQVGHD